MSRLSLVLACVAALAVGLVFLSSTAVHRLAQQLHRVQAEIAAEREQIEVLEADWALLNRPARLEALAERHLDLGPARADQFGTVRGIALRRNPATFEASETAADDETDPPEVTSEYRGRTTGPEAPQMPTVMVDVGAGAGGADEPLMITWGRQVRLPPASRVGDEIGVLIATLGGR